MEPLSAESIRAGLETRLIGQNVIYWPQVGSTNDEARRLAGAGAPEGTLVIADYQTAGRGRLDRRWEAPPGCCLLMSLLFRPELPASQVPRLAMICGLALAGAIEAETGLPVRLKWPNDVLVHEAKVAGMLAEVGWSGSRLDHVVVGLGLNVNLDPARLPGNLLMPATSLSQALGRPVDRLSLLHRFLPAVERRYLALRSGQSPHQEWTERLVTLGRPVAVFGASAVLRGVAEGVDADGALLLRLPDGRLEAVLAGDVTLRPQGGPPQA